MRTWVEAIEALLVEIEGEDHPVEVVEADETDG